MTLREIRSVVARHGCRAEQLQTCVLIIGPNGCSSVGGALGPILPAHVQYVAERCR